MGNSGLQRINKSLNFTLITLNFKNPTFDWVRRLAIVRLMLDSSKSRNSCSLSRFVTFLVAGFGTAAAGFSETAGFTVWERTGGGVTALTWRKWIFFHNSCCQFVDKNHHTRYRFQIGSFYVVQNISFQKHSVWTGSWDNGWIQTILMQ